MKHAIDPTVDCVFKALLGSERNKNLLVHFINATLSGELEAPVTTVEILNPYNDKTFMDDKLSIVDVKRPVMIREASISWRSSYLRMRICLRGCYTLGRICIRAS